MVQSVFNDVFFEYGDLLVVKSPSLIERYNRALTKLTGLSTCLDMFHVDCTGFSPEIAEELCNGDYLDAHGMNKKFILINMEQVEKDIVSTHFSSTMFSLKKFYSENYKALASLTARDAVIGELDNKQFKALRAIDVIKSNTVFIEVETANDLLKKSEDCMGLVERVIEGDAWSDDKCLESIIEHSKDCGSLLKNEALPRTISYRRHHYFTALFGGLYVFDDDDGLVVISIDPDFSPKAHGLSDGDVILIGDEKKVFKFLKNKGWLTELSFEMLLERVSQLELKQLHSVLDEYLSLNKIENFPFMEQQKVKQFIYKNYDNLPSDFYSLEILVNSLVNGDQDSVKANNLRWHTHEINSELNNKMYVLLSHLMCNFSTYSYFRLFVYNRKLFEKRYRSWLPAKQEYIKGFLFEGTDILNVLRSKQNVDLGM